MQFCAYVSTYVYTPTCSKYEYEIYNPLPFNNINERAWLMQKFCRTRGVALSMKFGPNLIFSTLQAINSLLLTFVPWLKVALSKEVNTSRENPLIRDARVIIIILLIPEATRNRGNTRNPGIGNSWRNEMQPNNAKIWITGLPNNTMIISFSERKALKDFSKMARFW